MMHWGIGYGWDWGAWFAMFVVMVVFWGALVWLVVYLIRRPGEPASPPTPGLSQSDDPLRILDERYARGEIDDDEYQRRRDVLSKGK